MVYFLSECISTERTSVISEDGKSCPKALDLLVYDDEEITNNSLKLVFRMSYMPSLTDIPK